MAGKVRVVPAPTAIEAKDPSWVTLKELRELVRQADERDWPDSCLVSHSAGGSDHPRLRYKRTCTDLIVEGPTA